jgi:hypothetical protein
MSISWDLLEGLPVAPAALAGQAREFLVRLTGDEGWSLNMHGDVEGVEWSWASAEDSLGYEPKLRFDLQITSVLGVYSGQAYASSDQELEDDGSPVGGHAAIEVLADRTQVSVITGLAVGLAALSLSGGELQGIPFSRWYQRAELDQMLADLIPGDAAGSSVESSIERLGRILGAQVLPL